MKHPPVALRAFPPLSHRYALRAGGRSQRPHVGMLAALAREPSLGTRRFHALRVVRMRYG